MYFDQTLSTAIRFDKRALYSAEQCVDQCKIVQKNIWSKSTQFRTLCQSNQHCPENMVIKTALS
jgi:hypothetical protein